MTVIQLMAERASLEKQAAELSESSDGEYLAGAAAAGRDTAVLRIYERMFDLEQQIVATRAPDLCSVKGKLILALDSVRAEGGPDYQLDSNWMLVASALMDLGALSLATVAILQT